MANGFGGWVAAHPGTVGVVGEFGVPGNPYATGANAYIAGDADKWAGLLETYYQRLQALGLSSLQWGASEAFRTYQLAPYTSPGIGSALNERHLNAGPLEAHAADAGVRRGVALTGLEFGDDDSWSFHNTNPGTFGTSYYANTQGSWNYVASRGITICRVGFRWERLQPTLGGALNGTYLGHIQTQVARATTAGVDVMLDLHNYGEYRTAAGTQKLGSAGLTSAHFADVWTRLAQTFATDVRVVGYGIMNEPHDVVGGNSGWQNMSQACVSAIRGVDASTPIYVSGHNWSKAQNWALVHPVPWITGTNIAYEAHHYFDSESSLNLGGPAGDSGYSQTYASNVADAAAAGWWGDTFDGADGLITDNAGYWASVNQNPNWAAESGEWWRVGNTAWTDSDLFRVWTRAENLQSVRIEFDLRNNGFLAGTPSRPAVAWDGVKIWLHSRHEDGGILGAPMSGSPAGYTAEVNLRDGRIYIQKKVPGDSAQWPTADSCIQGGCYFLLSSTPSFPAQIGVWERVGGQVVNNLDGSVTISVIRNGAVVLSVTDTGAEGGPPLRGPGRVGIRSDNTDYNVDNFTVG